jgi:hypothetical protein
MTVAYLILAYTAAAVILGGFLIASLMQLRGR